ncbi:alpha/beta hydrolase [Mycolicibacterium sp. 018/SC-01/001]|uniref:alpha/beta hydrolase n=1 Tax=Mycolicibacterium sp. 018/SC-01/001 TaxID=2592069 RepID=UPI00117DB6BA|nr:alpha/beta hydrolase [Mycolicibacterium sp. 018/SC-01/001]TRW81795.1 alpha/beta hydrolase [Mycolicibacterium sp. 018/SC-01/001]
MLTSAGVAAADDGTSSGTGTQASSNAGGGSDATAGNTAGKTEKPAKSATKRDRKVALTPHRGTSTTTESTEPTGPTESVESGTTQPEVTAPPAPDSEQSTEVEPTPEQGDTETGGVAHKPLRGLFGGGKHRAPEPDAETGGGPDSVPVAEAGTAPVVAEPVVSTPAAEPAAEPAASTQRRTPISAFATGIETDLGSPEGAMVMRLAAADAPPVQTQSTLLDVLNTIGKKFYDFYTGTMAFFSGPVRAPFGSTVRVESSTLTIGGHKDVPADWYFPDTDTPAGLIYLQHGFLANASFYSATAAYLAEKTDSIVVVPSLTWNPFDVDDYPLEWPSTGRAIAALFAGDRAALTASARLAGYDGVLPTRVVLAGHSAGGGLVAMVGRYMVETGNADDLAGIIMFDGVGTLSYMSQDIAAIPTSIPVYNIAAGPSSWNWYGDTNRKLSAVRPGMFTGVTFLGGKHADGMQTTAPIVQYFAYLAMGHSSPVDVMANKVLAAGWINDMLDNTHTDRLYDKNASAWSVVSGWWWDQLTSSSTRRVRTVSL